MVLELQVIGWAARKEKARFLKYPNEMLIGLL